MPLNPFRAAFGPSGPSPRQDDSPFQSETDAALTRFRMFRDDLERQVRQGDLTVKQARQQAEAAAEQMSTTLQKRAEDYSPTARIFLDRLIEASTARKKAREHLSLEGLQRETNRLLRQTIVEQQLQSRAGEFEAKTAVRPITGGPPAPTLESLLAFHQTTSNAGDEAGMEWTRRQLEGMRPTVLSEDDQRRIDLACDRPERVNPRLVSTYADALKEGDPESLESFVNEALEQRDANACMAAFMLARETPEGTRPRWVRMVLNGLGNFPDAALATLRGLEAEARDDDAEAAKARAEFAASLARSEAKLAGVEAPTEAELDRLARLRAKPIAQPGESIGLALDRRGVPAEEFNAAWNLDTFDDEA